MKLYIDNATNSLVTSSTDTATPTITLFKEDISSVEIRFVENGSVVDIGTPTIRLALGLSGSLIAFTEAWTKNGTGATSYWTGNFNLNTEQAEMALAGLSSIEAILEVEVRQGGAVATKAQLSVTLKTDLINETDTATDIGNIVSVGVAHIASTTAVHGIANTADLATKTYADGANSTHNSATTSVHGIANTADLATKAYADGAGLKAGVQWTDRHTTSTGNPYLIGSIVYNDGRVYRCIAENDSIPPQQGGNPYWADLGVGYLLPNENPKIDGGSINTRAGAVTQRTYETGDPENPTDSEFSVAGGNGGTITLKGGDGGFPAIGGGIGGNSGSINLSGFTGLGGDSDGGHGGSITLMGGWDGASAGSINLNAGSGGADNHGGSIISTGNGDHRGGTLNMSAGDGEGGSINTSGGGSINTSSKGGSINTSGYDANSGGSLNLSGGNSGAGGFIDGKNKGGFIKFYGTGTNPNGVGLGTGGSIDISAGRHSGGTGPIWTSSGVGGNGGSIQLLGGAGGEESNAGNGGNGGTIIGNGGAAISIGQNDVGEAILGTGYNGGTINFSAGSVGAGGSIDTSNGGGSINTRGVGSIQLGVAGTRTTINGSASGSDKTITLPNATGTIALSSHTHGRITSDGRVTSNRLFNVLINGSGYTAGNATVAGIPVIITILPSSGAVLQVTPNGNFDSVANGQYAVLQSGSTSPAVVTISGGVSYETGRPLITGQDGIVELGSFGGAPNSFCAGNDSRLGHGIFDIYQDAVDIGKGVPWTQQITLPTNLGTLIGGFGSSSMVAEISCIITNRQGTGTLFTTPPAFTLESLPSGGVSYSSNLTIGNRPTNGSYFRTANGVGSSNSSGKSLYSGGVLYIVSSVAGVYISTNLTAAMTASQTTMAINLSAFSGSDTYVKIDNEIVLITSGGNGLNPTIARGMLGTTPATHASGAIVSANIGTAGGGVLAKIAFGFKRFGG